MSRRFYAHSLENQPPEKWQPLEEHLSSVAKLATGFAGVFNAKCWAQILGDNHDLGKGTLPWQAFLRKANGVIDEFSNYYVGHPSHANVGAQLLYEHSKEAGKLLAYCIAGHHGGLPNWSDSSASALESRLRKDHPTVQVPVITPKFPDGWPFPSDIERFGFQLQFFVRMLFSCLVDADYLYTETSKSRNAADIRDQYYFPSIHCLHHIILLPTLASSESVV